MKKQTLVCGLAALAAAVLIPLSVFAEDEGDDLCDELTLLCDAVNQEERAECKENCPQPLGGIDDPGYEGYNAETAGCFMDCNIDYNDFKEIVCDNACGGGGDEEE